MGSVLLCVCISCCSWKGSREHHCMDGRRWLQAATRCVCLQRGVGRTQTAPGELSAARGGVSQHPSISWPRTGLCTDPRRRQGWSHRTGDTGGWDSTRGTCGSTPAWKGAVTPGHPGDHGLPWGPKSASAPARGLLVVPCRGDRSLLASQAAASFTKPVASLLEG